MLLIYGIYRSDISIYRLCPRRAKVTNKSFKVSSVLYESQLSSNWNGYPNTKGHIYSANVSTLKGNLVSIFVNVQEIYPIIIEEKRMYVSGKYSVLSMY